MHFTNCTNRKPLGSISTRVFETRTATGSELFSLLTCLHTTKFALHAKYLFSVKDAWYKNLGDTIILAREMSSSGCRPRLKNVHACLSSLLFDDPHELYGLYGSCQG